MVKNESPKSLHFSIEQGKKSGNKKKTKATKALLFLHLRVSCFRLLSCLDRLVMRMSAVRFRAVAPVISEGCRGTLFLHLSKRSSYFCSCFGSLRLLMLQNAPPFGRRNNHARFSRNFEQVTAPGSWDSCLWRKATRG